MSALTNQRRRRLGAPLLLVAVLAVLTACDGGDAETASTQTFAPASTFAPLSTFELADPDPEPDSTEESPSNASPSTSAAPAEGAPPTTTRLDQPRATQPPSTLDGSVAVEPEVAVDVWQAAWAAAAAGDREALSDLATSDVAARWATLFEGQTDRTVTHATFVVPSDGTTVVIDECVLISPPLTGSGAARFTGVVGAEIDGAPRVIDLRTEAMFDGCVPSSTSLAATSAYAEYWEVYFAVGAAPDPADPRLAEVATGGHLAFLQDLFTDLRNLGVVLRGLPEIHPEVSAYSSSSSLTIYDCQVPDAAYGVYDAATGALTDLDLPVRQGSRDEKDVDMVLEDGRWKVTERRGQADVGCETPSGLGVVVVGAAS